MWQGLPIGERHSQIKLHSGMTYETVFGESLVPFSSEAIIFPSI